MPKTLNIAVIGAGTMAQAVHLPVLRRRWDRFTVAALVDHSPRRRRESSEVWGVQEEKRYESVSDLIAAVRTKALSIDAALLSTDGLHVDDLLQLMRRGIPVLVEPPVGFSVEEVAKVADFERMTGRRLVMMAYPQQYDDSVTRMSEQIARKDLRMVDYEVLMPASQPLFGGSRVTTSSYDLPSEVRSQRRTDLQSAVVAGSGSAATQRDRDLYVKGLLTGVAHQMAVLEAVYGPIASLVAVRHWPKGVIPGSIELLGELDGGAHVRLVWHYLPFAPEYSEHIQVLSARRRMRVDLVAPSHGDQRSSVCLREKKSGVVQETSIASTKGAAEAMWEAFHSFVEKGVQPISGAEEARAQVTLLREVLSSIVAADGRSLEADPEDEAEENATQSDKTTVSDVATGPSDAESSEAAEHPGETAAVGKTADSDGVEAALLVTAPTPQLEAGEPAAETLEQDQVTPAIGADDGAASPEPADQDVAGDVVDVWHVESEAEQSTLPAASEQAEDLADPSDPDESDPDESDPSRPAPEGPAHGW